MPGRRGGTSAPTSIAVGHCVPPPRLRDDLDEPRPPAAARSDAPARVVLSTPHWAVGGVPAFCEVLARGLRALGREVVVVVTDPHHVRPDALPIPPGVTALNVPPSAGRGARRDAMRGLLESLAPCVWVPNHDWHNSWMAPRLSSRVAMVCAAHADDPDHVDHAVRLAPWWNGIVAVAPTVRDRVVAAEPGLASRVVVIRNGIPAQPFVRAPRPVGSPIRLVYAGRVIDEQKRVGDLAAIAARLTARGVAFEMRIVGDGPDRARLSAAFATTRVRFDGAVPRTEALAAFVESDVLLLTSAYEGLPLVALEAMAHGCVPVVTTAACDADLVEDGRTGRRLPVGDVDAFADAVAALAESPTQLAALAAAAHARVSAPPYTADHMASAWLRVLDDASAQVAAPGFRRPRTAATPPASAGLAARVGEHLRGGAARLARRDGVR